MWQIFTQNTEGLAIQSTGRLQNALAEKLQTVYWRGNYIDYKRIHPFDDMFSRFFQRKSFQYEREVHYIRWLKVRLPK
jgi:conjugal transfer/entry exclusion protein